jgi:hypothetical protein
MNPKIKLRLISAWGGSLGFVVGATLAALFYRWVGRWPESEQYLKGKRHG